MKRVFLTVLSVTLCFASFAKHVSIETAQRVAVNFWKTQTAAFFAVFASLSVVFPFPQLPECDGRRSSYVE